MVLVVLPRQIIFVQHVNQKVELETPLLDKLFLRVIVMYVVAQLIIMFVVIVKVEINVKSKAKFKKVYIIGRMIVGPRFRNYEYMSRLRDLLNRCKYRYYRETDLPEILSDHDYDLIESCLKDYEHHYPNNVPKDSPTQVVGAPLNRRKKRGKSQR